MDKKSMIEREPAFRATMRVELEHIKKTVTNPVLVDIGAHTGEYTLLMNQMFKDKICWIYAIEPDLVNFEKITEKLNDKTDSECGYALFGDMVISDKDSTVPFYVSDKKNLSSLIHRNSVHKKVKMIKSVTIPTLFITNEHTPDFIKMDIEGGEVLVLRGARDYLPTINCSILMEVHPTLYTDELSLEAELVHLFNNGWRCDRVISSAYSSEPEPFKRLAFISQVEVKDGWYRGTYGGDNDFALKYACYPYEIGIPDWRGGTSVKLVRSLLLKRES
jgi:FkbM family methyltransferase